jgi:predicted dehydrogenase
MNALVVGCGSIGKRHLRNLQQIGVDRLGAVDSREDRRQEIADAIGITNLYASVDEAMADGYDAVVAGVPTAYHMAVARSAIEHNAHVLVEKPLANNDEGVEELLKEAERRKLIFMVGYTYRFWPPLQKVKQLLDGGVIGRAYTAQILFSEYLPDWHPWEDYRHWFMASKAQGGGALLDESHTIDIARWLFGEIDSVFAINGRHSHLEIDADDLAMITAKFSSGLVGNIYMDIFGRHHRKELWVAGEKGNIYWDFYRNEVTLAEPGRDAPQKWTFEDDRNDMFLNQSRHWFQCIAGKEMPRVDGYDGLKTLRVILAAIESSETEKLVQTR